MDFMVDTGTEHSVVTQEIAPLLWKETTITGAQAPIPTGTHTCRPFCSPWQCWLRGHEVEHEILFLPSCFIPLMGRDLFAKMGAQISFSADG